MEADVNKAAGSDDFPDGPSGSGALAASSEADPWVARASGPWNPPDTTSPTLQSSHSGSTSPSHVRSSISNTAPQKTLLEIQNSYPQARPAIGQGASFSRSQPKSSLDPSSGPFNFVRKPSFGFNDDKENSAQFSNTDTSYDMDISSRSFRVDQLGSQNAGFLAIGSSASRDGSMPPSRASDSGINGGAFGNSNPSFGSIGHTPTSSIHSQRPSFSGLSGSYASQGNGSRYNDLPTQTDLDLGEKFARFGLSDGEQAGASQLNNNHGTAYSPNHPNFAQQHYQLNGGSTMWNDVSNGPKTFSYPDYSNQPFAEQAHFSKAPRFGDRGSVSPAGSDYRRGLNSPKYYPAAGTPPSGSDQIYRPSSRGPRIPQGPSELDRRLQNIHFTQQQNYLYNGHFQGQYQPHAYDYPPQSFRQGLPYGYPVPIPAYSSSQVVPTRPAKDQDVGLGVRSVLLEEFRSNSKSNKRYDLKVISISPVPFLQLIFHRISIITWSSSVGISMDHVSFNKSLRLPTAMRRSNCSGKSNRMPSNL